MFEGFRVSYYPLISIKIQDNVGDDLINFSIMHNYFISYKPKCEKVVKKLASIYKNHFNLRNGQVKIELDYSKLEKELT